MAPNSASLLDVVESPPVAKGNWPSLTYYSIGHFFIDLYSNSLGVFAPMMVDHLGISLTQAGLLGGIMSFSSSVTQPLFGYLSDRFRSPLFATLAPAVAGIFISTLTLAPSFTWLVFLVFMGGLGISSFHPAGSARAASGFQNRQLAMAIFISSGTLGLAFGPTFFSYLFDTFGYRNGSWAAVGGIAATLLMLLTLPSRDHVHSHRSIGFDLAPLKAVWKPLTILYFCVFLRSIVQIAFSAFLPLYLHRERGLTLTEASHLLSIYLAAGAMGGLLGGTLAQRFGEKRVIQASFLGSVPLMSLFFFSSIPWLANAGLIAGGFILLFTIPVNVVMAQQLAPTQTGTVSSLMMGASWGMAGLIAIPIVGWAGDHSSLHVALASLLIAPALGFFLTLGLKGK